MLTVVSAAAIGRSCSASNNADVVSDAIGEYSILELRICVATMLGQHYDLWRLIGCVPAHIFCTAQLLHKLIFTCLVFKIKIPHHLLHKWLSLHTKFALHLDVVHWGCQANMVWDQYCTLTCLVSLIPYQYLWQFSVGMHLLSSIITNIKQVFITDCDQQIAHHNVLLHLLD